MKALICFGDSITRGENDLEKGGWVERLKTFCMHPNLKDDATGFSVYNLGISGETSLGFEPRFKQELLTRSTLYDETIITIAFGANDLAIQNGELRVSEQLFTGAISRCVQIAKKEKVKVYILSILPTIESDLLLRRTRRAKDIITYNTALKKIAMDNGVCFLDMYADFDLMKEELLGDDGLHPNAMGHQFIVEFVKKELIR